jgi:hypothetical protein
MHKLLYTTSKYKNQWWSYVPPEAIQKGNSENNPIYISSDNNKNLVIDLYTKS